MTISPIPTVYSIFICPTLTLVFSSGMIISTSSMITIFNVHRIISPTRTVFTLPTNTIPILSSTVAIEISLHRTSLFGRLNSFASISVRMMTPTLALDSTEGINSSINRIRSSRRHAVVHSIPFFTSMRPNSRRETSRAMVTSRTPSVNGRTRRRLACSSICN